MWGVLAAIALIPSPPVLVPQLARAAAGEVAGFRDAALTAAAGLPDRWVVIGAGARGVAVISDIFMAEDIEAATRRLRAVVDGALQ